MPPEGHESGTHMTSQRDGSDIGLGWAALGRSLEGEVHRSHSTPDLREIERFFDA